MQTVTSGDDARKAARYSTLARAMAKASRSSWNDSRIVEVSLEQLYTSCIRRQISYPFEYIVVALVDRLFFTFRIWKTLLPAARPLQ